MSKKGYIKVKGTEGIYKNPNTGKFLSMKKHQGKQLQKTFNTLFEAKKWRKELTKETANVSTFTDSKYSTLKKKFGR